MSIELSLERIAKALENITETFSSAVFIPKVTPTVTIEKPVATPVPAAPVPTPVPVAAIPTPPVAVPTAGVSAPVVAPVTPVIDPSCPITDAKSLMDFLMTSFKSNPTLGAKIQDVLQSVGCKAVNEVQPQHYRAVYDGVTSIFAGN